MHIFLFLITLFFARPIQAETVYTVGVEDVDYSPIFSVAQPSANYQGYVRKVFDRFAKKEKISFRYVPLPIKRFTHDFWSNQLDFAFPDNPEWNKPEKANLSITYSEPVIVFQDAIFVRPEMRNIGIEQLKVLGTIKGFSFWKFQNLVDTKKIQIESAVTPEALIQMAILNRVDGINLALQVAYYHLKKMNKPYALVPNLTLLPIKDSHYHLSSIKYSNIILKFNAFLKSDTVFLNKLKRESGL